MSWYKEGSITLEQNSKKVIGSGTKWTNPLIGICSGQMLILKTQNTIEIYEIASVQSDTELTLAKQYDGETKSGLDYAIPTAPKVSIETLALRISEMLNYYQQQMEGWQTALTGEGEVTVTAPDGRVVTIKSQYSIQKELIQLVDQSKDFAQSASKSAITATDSASVATTSSDTAKIYADNANNSAKEASQSAINSANSAKSANTSEVNAKSSEIAAKNSADNAKEWVSTIDPQAIVRYCGDLDDIPPNHLGALSKGIYYQKQDAKARLELGYPVQEAGSLIILPTLTEGNQSCVQIYTLYKSGRQFIRNFRGSAEDGFWENWVEQITTANISADIARALPATRIVDNEVSTYSVGDSVDFKKMPTINGKSVLGTGDYGIGSYTGVPLNNPDNILAGGCYGMRTTSFPELQKNRNDSASLVVYPAWTKGLYVEKLAVVQSKIPRIYYRCSTPDGKQPFYEVITSANINKFCGQSVILYPGGSVSEPALLHTNQRIVIDNPFNTNLVHSWVEFYESGVWYKHDEMVFSNGGYGVKTNSYGNKIVIQTGNSSVRARCFHDGNPSGADNIVTSLPYRLIIVKIGV